MNTGNGRIAYPGGLSRQQRDQIIDLVLAVCWLSVGVLQLLYPDAGPWQEPNQARFADTTALAWVLTVGLCLPIATHRRHPLPSFIVSLTALFGMILADYSVGLLPFVIWILIYSVGVHCTRLQAALGYSCLVAGLFLTLWSDYPNFDIGAVVQNSLIFGACLTLGMLLAVNRRNTQARLELAEQRNVVANQRAETAVVAERLRLAQELHDIVAHSMIVISVQASMGSAAFDIEPEQARRALANIEQASRATLAELRGLLGVLRREQDPVGDLSPAPSLRDLRSVVANVESAGVIVDLSVSGPIELPAGVDAFAYRVAQEALTNVLKHAHATAVSIAITDYEGTLTMKITDNGRGTSISTPDAGEGHGIIGMTERVATFGGSLQTGSPPGGGFEVKATIPYASTVAPDQPRLRDSVSQLREVQP